MISDNIALDVTPSSQMIVPDVSHIPLSPFIEPHVINGRLPTTSHPVLEYSRSCFGTVAFFHKDVVQRYSSRMRGSKAQNDSLQKRNKLTYTIS